MHYLLLALMIAVIFLVLIYRGSPGNGGIARARSPRPPRPVRRRPLAPDDDPDFLREVDRRLREDGKTDGS